MDELKKCPFCGGKANLYTFYAKGSQYIKAKCGLCGVESRIFRCSNENVDSESFWEQLAAEEAIDTWNRRYCCTDCNSLDCKFNHDGECRFALVHERKPRITDKDGCIDYDYQEGEC